MRPNRGCRSASRTDSDCIGRVNRSVVSTTEYLTRNAIARHDCIGRRDIGEARIGSLVFATRADNADNKTDRIARSERVIVTCTAKIDTRNRAERRRARTGI